MAHKDNNRLFIKNMVCPRCISAVESILKKLDVKGHVALGEVLLESPLSADERRRFEPELKKIGFELIEKRVNKIVEEIKRIVLDYIANISLDKRFKLSSLLSSHLHYDYSYLSDLFSSVEGTTIEQFFLVQRIEKVKELLVYEEQSLTEIAYETGFSSVAHLSAQFKKITGLTASHFKKIGEEKRRAIHPGIQK